MRKKEWLAQNKDDLYNLGSDGLLSRLPDEILVSILSKLPLKDAVVTSKLSRRWRYLWCQTNCLVFEDCRKRWSSMHAYPNEETNKYISWVDQIIHQHKSPTIDKFKIRFGLDDNAKAAIDKWIKYAISKNVQTLDLYLVGSRKTSGNYCFPNKIFDRKCGSSLKRHSFNDTVLEIKFLRSLTLWCVDVDDEGLQKILNNCPVLEHLCILGSRKLVKPEIRRKGLVLKKLDIMLCLGLKSVEICDSNIVFFNCDSGSSVTLRFDNLQKLEKICIGTSHSWNELNDMLCQLSHVPCLQVLELDLYHVQGAVELLPLPKLQKLEQLTIIVVERDDEDGLLILPSLLEACPNLQRLTIARVLPRAAKTNGEIRQMAKIPHQSLEVVEYYGWTNDIELLMYFIQNCVALKKLVIEDKNGVGYNAQQQLKPITPVDVELVVL